MAEKMPNVIVLLPGITGSELVRNGRIVWGWSGRALVKNLLTGGDALVKDLWIDADSPTAESLEDGVTASRLLPDLHVLPGVWKIDGYGAIADFITAEFEVVAGRNFFPFPYDWRRDNRAVARLLKKRTDEWLHQWRAQSGNRDAKLILVAHSMGGLVSRYFLEVLEGWRDTRALITFGTPFRGSLNAVDAIANGLKELGVLDLTPLARRLNSLHQLLPAYECFDSGDGTLRRVVESDLPNADPLRISDAYRFHEEIRIAVEAHERDERYRREGYRIYPVVGHRQPTNQAARREGKGVKMLQEIRGEDPGGDGTVPRASALPREETDAAAAMFASTRHSALQNTDAVLTHLHGLLTGLSVNLNAYRGAPAPRPVQVTLALEDLYFTDEKVEIRARPSDGRMPLGATIAEVESGREVARLALSRAGLGWQAAEFKPPAAAAYRVVVAGEAGKVESAGDVFEVIVRSQ